MYRVQKRIEVSAMHHLDLDYVSPCINNHGHNWIITVTISGQELNKNGMIFDFKHIKEFIHDSMDHKNLNEVFNFNPTAENIAKWIADQVDLRLRIKDRQDVWCTKVEVQESEGNIAIWERQ